VRHSFLGFVFNYSIYLSAIAIRRLLKDWRRGYNKESQDNKAQKCYG